MDVVILTNGHKSKVAKYDEALTAVRAAKIEIFEDQVHDHADAALDVYLEAIDDAFGYREFASMTWDEQHAAVESINIDAPTFFAFMEHKKAHPRPSAYTYSLKEAMESHIESKLARGFEEGHRTSIGKTRKAVELWLESQNLRDQPMIDITLDRVSLWRDQQFKSAARGTISDRLNNLAQIWDHAVELGKVADSLRNPFRLRRVTTGKALRSRNVRPMSPEEAKAVLADLSDEDRFPFLIAWYTGCRMSEALSITPKDVQERDGVLTLTLAAPDTSERTTGKTPQSTRTVPVHPELEAMVKEFRDGLRPIQAQRSVRQPKHPIDAYEQFINKRIKRHRESNGVTFHSIRHHVVTHLRQEYPHLRAEIGMLTGHKGPQDVQTKHYYHGATLERLRELVMSIPSLSDHH